MPDAVIGFWIGTTALSLAAGGTYAIGGSSLLDDIPLHGGKWTLHDTVIEFRPDPGAGFRPSVAVRDWSAPSLCNFKFEDRTLTLADCPYHGSYLPQPPRTRASP